MGGIVPIEEAQAVSAGMEENEMVMIPAIDMAKTGQNILAMRQQAGLSVKELQEVFGFATPQAIYKWQQGAAMPAIDHLVVLAMLFQVHIDDILVIEDCA